MYTCLCIALVTVEGHRILSPWRDVLDRFWRVHATSKSVLDLYVVASVKPSSTIAHLSNERTP